jgi:hypothetical protein
MFQYAIAVVFGLATTACGGSTAPAKNATSVDSSAASDVQQPVEPTPAGSGVEVGMQFEDKGDPEKKADRTPPPTPTYKPASKDKKAAPAKLD